MSMNGAHMISTKLKLAAAALGAAAIVTALVLQNQRVQRLKSENNKLREELNRPGDTSVVSVSAGVSNEIARSRAEHDELLRLRGELGPLRRQRDELQRRVALPNTNNSTFAAQKQPVDTAWVKQILAARPAQQGAA